jgi:hypothetical protein
MTDNGRKPRDEVPQREYLVLPCLSSLPLRGARLLSLRKKLCTHARSHLSVCVVSARDHDQPSAPLPLESPTASLSRHYILLLPALTAFTDDPDPGSEHDGEETEDGEDVWSDDTAGMFDFVTERNMAQIAQIAVVRSNRLLLGEINVDGDAAMDPDPLVCKCHWSTGTTTTQRWFRTI